MPAVGLVGHAPLLAIVQTSSRTGTRHRLRHSQPGCLSLLTRNRHQEISEFLLLECAQENEAKLFTNWFSE